MRVPLSWLREFVPVEAEVGDLADRLTRAGLHIDEVVRLGVGIEGVVVGEVLDVRDHPDADSLVLVRADAGDGVRDIVCGARNFAPGDRVPVALPGAKLPGGMEIGERTVRGQPSRGMLCSPSELHVSDDHSGILVLDRDAPIGADVRTALGLDDAVFVVDVTPNRPDALCVAGVARDVAAIYGLPFELPEITVPEEGPDASALASVRLEDRSGCPRYLARVVSGLRVDRSPWWIRRRLLAAGMRPISNVVDVTNYVLLERGHPLHAFDLATLEGGGVVVRRPRKGERITTLDGVERAPVQDDVLICDAGRPVAVAGIMGGAETEVSEKTTDVLLEAAYFDAARIARTARRLGLRTEASVRFERGADPEAVPSAAARAAALIAEVAGGVVARGSIDVYPRPVRPRRLRLRVARANALLGTRLTGEEMAGSLEGIGCTVTSSSRTALRVEAPTYRPDLVAEEDLLEEVARLHGYDNVPATLSFGGSGGRLSREQSLRRLVRRALLGAGLSEAQTLTFLPAALPDRLGLPVGHAWRDVVRVTNPLSEEESALRPSLVPGLLLAAARNVARRNTSVALFEIGTAFRPSREELPGERLEAAWVLAGPAQEGWQAPERAVDVFDASGVLEAVLAALGVAGWAVRALDAAEAPWHRGRAAAVLVGGERVGTVAELHPRAARALDLAGRVAVGHVAMAPLLTAASEFLPGTIPRFPAVRRDLSVVAGDETAFADVEAQIRQAGGELLESADLLYVYRGAPIPEGSVSLTFALALRSADRTLTDADADELLGRVVEAVRRAGWSIRA